MRSKAEPAMVIAIRPTGIVVLMLAGWLGCLPRTVWRTSRQLSEGYLEGRMRKSTVLADAAVGFKGAVAVGWDDEAGRRQRLTEIRDPGGERRPLFGVGEGPAEAVAGVK